MIFRFWIILLSFNLLLIQIKACDFFTSITVKENVQYPSSNLLDVAGRLHEQRITLSIERDSIYLTDLAGSKPFTLYRGILSISSQLDREQICKKINTERKVSFFRCCTSMCCMYIGVTTSQGKTFYIKVNIEDENDNEPVFPQQSIKLQIHENVEMGYKIVIPKAEDLDSQNFGIDRYELVQDKNCGECFHIKTESQDGGLILLVKTKIDREQNSIFHLLVLAIDKDVPGKTGTLSVIIDVIDVNDNSPQFEESSLLISEEENGNSGRLIRQIKVTDADTGVNSQITYVIEDFNFISQKYFRVIPVQNGVSLYLQSTLDYEKINHFNFKIIAKDHGTPSLFSTITINVNVINCNDEPPEIVFFKRGLALDSNHIIVDFPENGLKQQSLILIHVSDKDSKRSDINCEVSYPKDVFYLHENQQANLIDNKKLFELQNSISFDRENINMYRISIICSDSISLDRLSSSTEIQIRVTDVNDNSPIFGSTYYFGKFVETNTLDKIVHIKNGNVKVTDADINENSRIVYSLADINNSTDSHKFSITRDNAQVKNNAPIDFEEKKRYIFLIIAKDCGHPSLSSSATITVNVIDANDNSPEISQKSYSFSVLEEQPIGKEIGIIEVTDADTDPSNIDLIYEMVSHDGSSNSNPNKLFFIENSSGRLKTKITLDHEKVKNVNFLVKVRNTNDQSFSRDRSGTYGSSTPVSVRIIDINDNPPKLILKENQNQDFININDISKIPIIYINNDIQSTSNPCSLFPYTFIDADDGINADVRVTLKENSHFVFEMGHNLICPKTSNLASGSYTVYVIGEDRNGGNGSKRSEYPVNVIVKASILNKQPTLKKIPRPDPEERTSDYRVIIIIIFFIFTIILIIIVIAIKFCISRNMSPSARNREKADEKLSNIGTNNNYNVIIPEGSCDKRLRSNLNNQNVINSDYSNNLFYPGTFSPNENIMNIPYHSDCILSNISSNPNEFMFADHEGTVMVRNSMNQKNNNDQRYEQLNKNTKQSYSGTAPTWDKTKSQHYNYLLEQRDSSSLSSNCGKVSPPKQDIIAVAGCQKSINDIYLQTSFV